MQIIFMTKRFLFFLIFLSLASLSGNEEITPPLAQKAVTYKLSGGRLGNNLIAYLHGKWISHKYHLPLLYVPFPYSDQFVFHHKEPYLNSLWNQSYQNKLMLQNVHTLRTLKDSTLVIIPYFRDEGPRAEIAKNALFKIPWSNQKFLNLVRDLLKPIGEVKTLSVPKGKLNVLLHVRTGGGFDERATQLSYPYKFPPHSFYISSLKKISLHFGHPPIYAYIMTDDPHPENLAKLYKSSLSMRKNIVFDFRKEAAGPSQNVLEDFFSVQKFDCIIRGDSTFTIVASLLGQFKAIISPKKCHVANGEVIVDEVDFKVSDKKLAQTP